MKRAIRYLRFSQLGQSNGSIERQELYTDQWLEFNEVKLIFGNEYLSPDFKLNDVMIGHSYFLTNDENELKVKLDFEIKPILKEYLKDGILLESAAVHIENLKV